MPLDVPQGPGFVCREGILSNSVGYKPRLADLFTGIVHDLVIGTSHYFPIAWFDGVRL